MDFRNTSAGIYCLTLSVYYGFNHTQLIYERSGTIQLLTLKPQRKSDDDDLKLRFLGIRVPSAKYVCV